MGVTSNTMLTLWLGLWRRCVVWIAWGQRRNRIVQLVFSLLYPWRFFLPAVLRGFRVDLFCEGNEGLFSFFSLEPLFFSAARPGLSEFRHFCWPGLLAGALLGRVLSWFVACLLLDLFFFEAPVPSLFDGRPLCGMFFILLGHLLF